MNQQVPGQAIVAAVFFLTFSSPPFLFFQVGISGPLRLSNFPEHMSIMNLKDSIVLFQSQFDNRTASLQPLLCISMLPMKYINFGISCKKNVYLGAINKLGFQSKKLRIFIYFYLHLLNDCQL